MLDGTWVRTSDGVSGVSFDLVVRTSDIKYHETSIILRVANSKRIWQSRYFGVGNVVPIFMSAVDTLQRATYLSRIFMRNRITTAGIR